MLVSLYFQYLNSNWLLGVLVLYGSIDVAPKIVLNFGFEKIQFWIFLGSAEHTMSR